MQAENLVGDNALITASAFPVGSLLKQRRHFFVSFLMATRCAKRSSCEGACPGNSRLAIFSISQILAQHSDLKSENLRVCPRFVSERLSLMSLIPAPQPPAAALHKLQAQPALAA